MIDISGNLPAVSREVKNGMFWSVLLGRIFGTWVGWREDLPRPVPPFILVAPDGEGAQPVLPHGVPVHHPDGSVFI